MKKQIQEILAKEGMVKNEPAMQILAEGETLHGRLILTPKRIFFAKNVIKASGFDNYEIREQKLEAVVDIDLDTINFVTQERYVVDENILSITYLQYENVKFSVINYSEWEECIQRARMTPDIPGDPNARSEAA